MNYTEKIQGKSIGLYLWGENEAYLYHNLQIEGVQRQGDGLHGVVSPITDYAMTSSSVRPRGVSSGRICLRG